MLRNFQHTFFFTCQSRWNKCVNKNMLVLPFLLSALNQWVCYFRTTYYTTEEAVHVAELDSLREHYVSGYTSKTESEVLLSQLGEKGNNSQNTVCVSLYGLSSFLPYIAEQCWWYISQNTNKMHMGS